MYYNFIAENTVTCCAWKEAEVTKLPSCLLKTYCVSSLHYCGWNERWAVTVRDAVAVGSSSFPIASTAD